MTKSMLIICNKAPWSGISVKETLDLALAGGAFDLPISLLFLGDGVFQLIGNQQPKKLEQKDITANLQALPLFGIEHFFVSQDCLALRGLSTEHFILPVELLSETQLNTFLTDYDIVVTS